ncbi:MULTISPECIES: hypothetical protein [Bacillaceae]|uniref:hypothetical protein n=1 Tax=Bacillaceae TaxID=186817 RepID=UPI001627CDA9|nr:MULTISPECIES: hypothetical protein [Bacillaceae]
MLEVSSISLMVQHQLLYRLSKSGDFAPALTFIACITFAGAMSYIFLVGKIERVQDFADFDLRNGKKLSS